VNGVLNLNANGGTSYAWNGPSAFASTQQNPSLSGVNNSASGIYTVTVTDANSCYSSATVSVTVNPLPVVTAGGATVCVNGTVNLSASNGGVNYSWSGPNNFASNQQNPSMPNATPALNGSYVVTVTDANGCANANVAQVLINPLPIVSATSASVCAGSPATLTASGANSYIWSPANGLSTANAATVTATVNANTTYTVTGTNANGCAASALAVVNVNALPQVSISPAMASGCAPLCVDFFNTSLVKTNCNWNFGDGSTDNTSCTPHHCFGNAGSYAVTLTLTGANGCSNSSVAQITVYPQPHAAFFSSPQPATLLDPSIHFTDNSLGAVINSWHWNFGDAQGSTSTMQNPVFTYADGGNYAVQLIVTSDHGCADTITQTVQIDEDYSLYIPNAFTPDADGLNDVFMPQGEGIQDYRLFIFDRWGNRLFYSEVLEKGWDGTYESKGSEIVQEDVYVWKIELKSKKGERKYLSGTVTLLK
jgi:gliding motility-associated-like protein